MQLSYRETEQKMEFIHGRLEGKRSFGFGLTEPNHGSDATFMFTHAQKATRNNIDGWVIDGGKMWISGMHRATHCIIFARTHGKAGDAKGITAFFVQKGAPGFEIESYEWTFNMVSLFTRASFYSFEHVLLPIKSEF